MEDSKEVQETAESENTESPISKELNDFSFLISTITEYYQAKSGMKGEFDEGDEWKKGTTYEPMQIPEEVDDAVKMAFLKQLKNFV